MNSLSTGSDSSLFQFSGTKYRIFIEGRGFDFISFDIYNNHIADLNLTSIDDPLFSYLDFQEPRVLYVVSRRGKKVLLLQGCVFKSINGSDSRISYTKLQTES